MVRAAPFSPAPARGEADGSSARRQARCRLRAARQDPMQLSATPGRATGLRPGDEWEGWCGRPHPHRAAARRDPWVKCPGAYLGPLFAAGAGGAGEVSLACRATRPHATVCHGPGGGPRRSSPGMPLRRRSPMCRATRQEWWVSLGPTHRRLDPTADRSTSSPLRRGHSWPDAAGVPR
jgi:hypothetical protein